MSSRDLDYKVHAALTGEQPSIGFSPYTSGVVQFCPTDIPKYSTDYKFKEVMMAWLQTMFPEDSIELWRADGLPGYRSLGYYSTVVFRVKTTGDYDKIRLGSGPTIETALCNAVLYCGKNKYA